MSGPALHGGECVRCGAPITAAVPMNEPARGGAPEDGAVWFCPECQMVQLFTGAGFEVRAPTAAERAELEADPDVLLAAVEFDGWVKGRRRRGR